MKPEEIESFLPIANFGSLAVLWTIESVLPFFEKRPKVLQHGLVNLGLFIPFLAVNIALAGFFTIVNEYVTEYQIGFLNWLHIHGVLGVVLGMLLIDLALWADHLIRHKVSFFWRFHRIHHSDENPDSTTALRFHPGEQIISAITFILATILFGISPLSLALYLLISIPWIVFTHSNLLLPQWLNRPLSYIIATPNVHRLHHSDYQPETDSNYGCLLIIWDRLFGTYREREDSRQISFGLTQYKGHSSRNWWQQMKLPFQK